MAAANDREDPSWHAKLPRLRQRRRERHVGPRTLSAEAIEALGEPRDNGKRRLPMTRAGCESGPRPCPLVSCRHHLYLDVSPTGSIRLNFPDLLPEDMVISCSLDLADEGPLTLDQVAQVMNLTRERVRQLQDLAKLRMRDLLVEVGIDDGPGNVEILSAWEILYP